MHIGGSFSLEGSAGKDGKAAESRRQMVVNGLMGHAGGDGARRQYMVMVNAGDDREWAGFQGFGVPQLAVVQQGIRGGGGSMARLERFQVPGVMLPGQELRQDGYGFGPVQQPSVPQFQSYPQYQLPSQQLGGSPVNNGAMGGMVQIPLPSPTTNRSQEWEDCENLAFWLGEEDSTTVFDNTNGNLTRDGVGTNGVTTSNGESSMKMAPMQNFDQQQGNFDGRQQQQQQQQQMMMMMPLTYHSQNHPPMDHHHHHQQPTQQRVQQHPLPPLAPEKVKREKGNFHNPTKLLRISQTPRKNMDGKTTSLSVFQKYVKINEFGELDVSGLISRECYDEWVQTRRNIRCPEECFRKALISHITVSDGGSLAFEPEVEAKILEMVRKQRVWPCFAGRCYEGTDKPITIGSKGLRTKGFHERKLLGLAQPVKKRNRKRKSSGSAADESSNKKLLALYSPMTDD